MEKLICGSRYNGKTAALIRMSHEDGTTIVCHSKRAADTVSWQAKTMGIEIPKPMSVSDLRHDKLTGSFYLKDHHGVLVDDADLALEAVLGVHVIASTMTCENIEVPNE